VRAVRVCQITPVSIVRVHASVLHQVFQIRWREQVVTHQPAISSSIASQHPFNRAGGRTFDVMPQTMKTTTKLRYLRGFVPLVCALPLLFSTLLRPRLEQRAVERQLTTYASAHQMPRSALRFAGSGYGLLRSCFFYATDDTFDRGVRVIVPLVGPSSLKAYDHGFETVRLDPTGP